MYSKVAKQTICNEHTTFIDIINNFYKFSKSKAIILHTNICRNCINVLKFVYGKSK